MQFKEGVKWVDMHPSVDNPDLHERLDKVYRKFGVAEAVITSGRDGTHKAGSFHYEGKAFDLRISNVLAALVLELRRELGSKYDVILEGDHVHVEVDGKEHPL